MKILDINWQEFLNDLAAWRELPFGDRRVFLRTSQSETGSPLEQRQPFARVMRALYANPVHESPSRKAFDEYLGVHFTVNEKFAFGGPEAGRGDLNAALFKRLTSREYWVQPFVLTADMTWETAHIAFGQRRYIATPPVLKAMQRIAAMACGDGLATIGELGSQLRDVAPSVLAAAIQASLRYMILFASVRGEDLEPVVGPWPLAGPKVERSREFVPVEARDVYHEAFLLEDMTAALSACIAEPFKLRGDSSLYAKTWKQIEPGISTQPEWVTATFRLGRENRLEVGVAFLQDMDFVAATVGPDRAHYLTATSRGMAWLPLSAKARLKAVLDSLRGRAGEDWGASRSVSHRFLPYAVELPSNIKDTPDFAQAVATSFLEVPAGGFVTLKNFFDRNATERNPLLPLLRRRDFYSLRLGRHWLNRPDEEELDGAWHRLLTDFLIQRLVPLGGVKVGIAAKSDICLSVTPEGRYFLTGKGDFEYGQTEAPEVVVQPNFDVVFLAHAAAAEAEISRFAERKGRKVGALFHISKKSILSAAAGGLTVDYVMDVLKRVCARELPANVEREIRGWFGACRRVETRTAVLLDCPDADTAVRVLAAARGKARAISDTVLELTHVREKAAVARKLRDSGIFL